MGEHANEPRHRHGTCQLFKHLRAAGQAKPSRAELSWRGQRDTWSTLGQDADMAAAKQCSTSSATQRETEKKRNVAWSTKQKSPLLSPRCVAIASVFVCVCVQAILPLAAAAVAQRATSVRASNKKQVLPLLVLLLLQHPGCNFLCMQHSKDNASSCFTSPQTPLPLPGCTAALCEPRPSDS